MNHKHLILLVEDDRDTATALGDLLVSLNYQSVHASTADEARQILATKESEINKV